MEKLSNKIKSLETIIVLALASILGCWFFEIQVLLYFGVGFLVIGIISKSLTQIIHFLWMKLAEGLSYVSSRIILSVVFYFFLTPISLFYRLFKKNSLFTSTQSTNSNFVERNYEYSEKDIENPW